MEQPASRLLPLTLAALDDPACRVLVHQGGSRTSKTWSICQAVVRWLHDLERPSLEIDIVRKRSTDLKASAEADFFKVLNAAGLYREERHSKTDHAYTSHTGSRVQFDGLMYASGRPNDALKGRSRDILWWNEPTDGTLQDWEQLIMRTSRLAILDYNPDYAAHWIYDKVLTRDDCRLVVSTWEDGAGLVPEGQIQEILRLAPVYRLPSGEVLVDWEGAFDGEGDLVSGDPAAWAVYGLGQRGTTSGAIYPHWYEAVAWPDAPTAYGLDLGFSRPAALVRVALRDVPPQPELYWQECLYLAGLTNPELAAAILDAAPDTRRGSPDSKVVYCDQAEPKTIRELYDAGINAQPCDKKTSVWEQIKFVKKHRLYIVGESVNLKREIRSYRRRTDRAGILLDEPVPVNDHACDGGRYGSWSAWGRAMVRSAQAESVVL